MFAAVRAALPVAALLLASAQPVVAADYKPVGGGHFASVLPADEKAADTEVASFSIRATPVTNEEFLAFVTATPAWRRDDVPRVFADGQYLSHWPGPTTIEESQRKQPVTHVSWFAAAAFCESEGARLPTWSEWEFVASADATRTDARSDPKWREQILSWYSHPSNGVLANVGAAANVYGVRDTHGLVWEWVDDFNALLVSADSRDQNDPDRLKFCGAGAMSLRDLDNYAVLMRIAMLSSLKAADTTANVGFRCARQKSGPNP